MVNLPITRRNAVVLAGACVSGAVCAAAGLSGCDAGETQSADMRCGSILTSDGVVLARSDESKGGYIRVYPERSMAAALVGARPLVLAGAYDGLNGAGDDTADPGLAGSQLAANYDAGDSIDGQKYDCLESAFRSELESGADLTVTLDSQIQRAAESVLGENMGAVVVMDCATGAIRAMASYPTTDLGLCTAASGDTSLPDGLKNHALDLHIPGSLQKTVTLATALSQGASITDERSVKVVEMIDGQPIENASSLTSDTYSLGQAYAESLNTVYGPLALEIGLDPLLQMADALGFGDEPLVDFPGNRSRFQLGSDSSDYQMAWECLGQALYVNDHLEGPLVSAVHMASIFAALCNGGLWAQPYIASTVSDQGKSSISDPAVQKERVLSSEVAQGLYEAALLTVSGGTGKTAQVSGVTVGGKTGTGITAGGEYNGWFCGFAQRGDESYALAVLARGATSEVASSMAGTVVRALFKDAEG